MVDIAKVKSEIRAGFLKVYEKNGFIYMENSVGERIVLYKMEDK